VDSAVTANGVDRIITEEVTIDLGEAKVEL